MAAILVVKRWLVVRETGAAHITVNKPVVGADEVAIHLIVRVPGALFTRPRITAEVNVPDTTPDAITAEVLENVADAVHVATGLNVVVNLVPAGGDEK